MRILISTPYLGGTGGIERHVASTIQTLGDRHEIDVCATRHHLRSGYDVHPVRGRILPRSRWHRPGQSHRAVSFLWRVAHVVRRRRAAPYDVYLYYRWGEDVQDEFRIGVRFVIPCGDDVRALEHRFDSVLLEAPGNDKWVGDVRKAVLLPPPLDTPGDHSVAVEGVPPEFFLTIFNPNHQRKGFEDLCQVAAASPVPVVWCSSSDYARAELPPDLTALVVFEDLTQEQLRFLYERCRAYISFDETFGFGWSLADALQYGAPTLSRRDGVMTIPGLDSRGSRIFGSIEELVELVQHDDFEHVDRDLDEITPDRFVERFEAIVERSRTELSHR